MDMTLSRDQFLNIARDARSRIDPEGTQLGCHGQNLVRLQHPCVPEQTSPALAAVDDGLLMYLIEGHPERLTHGGRRCRTELQPVNAVPEPGIVHVRA